MDRSIYPHISNDIMFYSQDEEVPGMLDMTYYPFRDPELIFKEENYEVCTSRRQENIIEYLVSSIHQNKPVIIWVDCFYEDIRLDMYHKEHWAHTLLIVGYNDDTKQFAIMEHSNKESLNYGLKWISYSSLKESYDAFFNWIMRMRILFPRIGLNRSKSLLSLIGSKHMSTTYLNIALSTQRVSNNWNNIRLGLAKNV